jgi:hypothetical protein
MHVVPMDTHHPSSEENGGSTIHHAKAAGGYFAVLISVLLGTFVWSWRRSFRVLVILVRRRITNHPVAPPVPYPPRSPTLYLFQVIRR